ncbi:MAG: nuclear transport factor 2 family protein [Myxococcota bacterium]
MSAGDEERAEAAGRPLDREAAEALVAAYLARHGEADLEGVVALFAPEARLEDPVGSPVLRGREAIRTFYRETHRRNGRLVFERVGGVLCGGRELVLHVRAALARDPGGAGMDVVYVIEVDAAGRIGSLRAWF